MTVMVMVLVMTGANAQKVNQRLIRLMSQNREMKEGRRASAQCFEKAMVSTNRQMGVQWNADGSAKAVAVTAYLKKGAECPIELLKAKGIEVHRVIDNMVSMTVPVEKLMEFEAIDEFILVNPTTVSRTFNMEAGKSSKASIVNDATQAVANGLPQAYTGKGVVVGIIDRGIDYNHAAFLDANGNTRVVKVLNFDNKSERFLEYNTPAEIATVATDIYIESHGTHTSAIAVGSECGNSLHGVATEAEIILVGRSLFGTDENTVDAIDRIFKYADSKNMPAVINISMGHMNDLHDGSTLIAKAIRQQTNGGTKPGRIVVMSAGNSADNRYSIVKKLDAADANGWQLKTVLGSDNVPTATEMPTYSSVNAFMYASDGKEFTAALKAVNIETGEVKEVGEMSKVEGIFDPEAEKGEKININGKEVVTWSVIVSECTMTAKDWRLAIFVKGTAGQTITMVRGDEGLKEWGLYAPEKLKSQDYTDGCPDMAFNCDACDDAIISVGAYTTLTEWADYYANMKHFTPSKITGKEQVVGEIADFSSFCVDNNGKNRPTVLAPGQGLLSAFNGYDTNYFTAAGVNTEKDLTFLCPDVMKISKNNRDHRYGMMTGTSMSSPHTAGIVALWLQASPQLTEQQVVDIIKETSMKDDFVTDVTKIPSHNLVQAGNGKIDALAGLKKILNTTDIETISMGDRREATPATMYSVDAPVYNMMGQRVDKSQKGLVIYKGRKYVNK